MVKAAAPQDATPKPGKQARSKESWAPDPLELVFELVAATEVGLVVLGVLAVGVGLPILLMLLGAALAQRMRRKPAAQPKPLWTAIAAPGVLLLALLVVLGAGVLSWEAFRTGHPVGVAAACAGAGVTMVALGWAAVQRRRERDGA